jgi:hypothetical protein
MAVVVAVAVVTAVYAGCVTMVMLSVWVGLNRQSLTECEDDKGRWHSEYHETN